MKPLGANIRITSKVGKMRIEQTADYIKISGSKIRLNGQVIK